MTPPLASALLLGWVLPGAALAAPPAPLPRTGQETCFQGTAAAPCAGTGQDAETSSGVAWPEPRFADGGDQTVTDRLTGLVWAKDANAAGGSRTWPQALDAVRELNDRRYLGHGDWRLPNVAELESLVAKRSDLAPWLGAQGFTGVLPQAYWTSSTYAGCATHAWCVGLYSGIVAGRAKVETARVWPVRGAAPGAVSLPRTGQSLCYGASGAEVPCPGTGQDGALGAGAAWPSPRFAAEGDGAMRDRLTGLVWARDGASPGPATCGSGEPRTWQAALDHVRCLNANLFLGWSDWRVPNRNELASLASRGEPDSARWLRSEGFRNVPSASFWSSSTYPYNTWNAWSVNLRDGAVTSMAKRHELHVWPVRGAP